MIRFNMKRMAALAALASGMALANTASAQYTTTVGNTPGGGNTVVGNGVLGPLATGDGNLSSGGFDNITFNIGSTATGSGVDTVFISTGGNTLLNNGTITGDALYSAISFASSSSLNGETITNNGVLNSLAIGPVSGSTLYANPASSSYGNNIGAGLGVSSGGGINQLTVAANGSITGGSFGDITSSTIYGNDYTNDIGGNLVTAIAIDANGAISQLAFTGNGTITGGSFGDLNSSSTLYGNNESDNAGGNIATAIAISSLDSITNSSVVTSGAITGGSIGDLNGSSGIYGNDSGDNEAGGNIVTGLAINSVGSITSLAVGNNGSVTGGSIGDLNGSSAYIYGNNSGDNEAGGNIATGIAISADGSITSLAVANNGPVTGGSIGSLNSFSYIYGNDSGDNEAGGNIATGISIDSIGSISLLTLANNSTITGGSIGAIGYYSGIYGNDSSENEVGGNIATALSIGTNDSIAGLTLVNKGAITGGSIGGMGNNDGYSYIYGNDSGDNEVGGNIVTGLSIGANGSISNLSITNSATIKGGSIGGMGTAGSGYGYIYGNDSSENEIGGNTATALSIGANGSITSLGLTNNANIIGGSIGGMGSNDAYGYIYGNDSGDNEIGGNIATGISIDSNGSISGLSLINTATVAGGSIGGMTDSSYIYGNDSSENEIGGNIATAISIGANSSISNLSLTNTFAVIGGSIGGMTDSSYIYGNDSGDNEVGGNIATAIAIDSNSSITSLTLNNKGAVVGGSIGGMDDSSYIYGNDSDDFEIGGNIATGIAIGANSSINSLTLNNTGVVKGGSIGGMAYSTGYAYIYGNDDANETGGNIATAIAIDSNSSISLLTLNNSGSIIGGSIGGMGSPGSAYAYIYGNDSGDNEVGGNIATALAIGANGSINGLTLTNTLLVVGGSIGGMGTGSDEYSYIYGNDSDENEVGGNIATAIAIDANSSITSLTLNNSGPVIGGSIGGMGANDGNAYIYGNDSGDNEVGGNIATGIAIGANGPINGLTLTNTSLIAGGSIGGMGASDGYAYIYGNDSGNNEIGGNIATAIAIGANSSITSLTLSNKGSVIGGSIGGIGDDSYIYGNDSSENEIGGNIATGIAIDANGPISFLSLANKGSITGGSIGGMGDVNGYAYIYGNDSGDNEIGGNIATALAIGANSSISSLSLGSSGSVTGGSIGGMAVVGDNYAYIYGNDSGNNEIGGNIATGIAIGSNGVISSLLLGNSGSVTGGSIGGMGSVDAYAYIYGNDSGNNEIGGNIATAIAIGSFDTTNNLTLLNAGPVTGGSIGGMFGGSSYTYIYGNDSGNYEIGGNIATGIAIGSGGSITGLSLINISSVTGGSIGGMSGGGGYYSYIYGNDSGDYEIGGNIATAIAIGSYDVNTGLSLVNFGTVIGGSIGGMSNGSYIYGNDSTSYEVGGNIATGIAITSFNSISGASLVNFGTISGGSIGNMTGGSYIYGNGGSSETGGNIGTGLAITSMGSINGLSLVNVGTIKGGSIGVFSGGAYVTGNNSGSDVGGDVLSGVAINSGVVSTGNNLVVNYGTILGGNSASGNAGAGISSNTGRLTINNWGTISAGSGLSTTTVPGFPPASILLSGGHNTVNLNGHSTTPGTIQATGVGDVLNLNFTGMSPAAIAALKAQLAAQGYPANNFTGAFTVRGVTTFVDPLVIVLNLSSYQLQGITPNQQAIGANLDSFVVNPTGATLALLNAIDVSGNVPLALDQLSPQKYQIYGDIALAAMTFQSLTIDDRLNNLRDGSESIDTTGIGGNTDKTSAGFSKDGKDNKSVTVPEKASMEKRWGFFAAGSGVFGDVDGRDGLTDASFTTGGVMMGIDGKINDNFVAGLLFDYSHTQADLDAQGSTANIETYGGGVYSGFHDGPWYANGLLSYMHNSYDSARAIVFPGVNTLARGGTDGNQVGVNIDGGYDFHITDRFTVGPLVGLQYVHADVSSFNEYGAGGANLGVGSQDIDSLRSRLGVRADYHMQVKNGLAIAVEARAAWQHEYLDDSRSISGQFIGSGLGAFNVQTSKPQRDAALVGVGFNATCHDKWTVFVDYDVQAGQESYLEQSVKAGLKVAF